MAERVQVILKPEEKVRLQRQAEREGTSLSAWLRQVALDRLAQSAEGEELNTVARLRSFWEHCADIEEGQEPDWEQQRAVIARSRRSGASDT
jgi:hypothetical protein